MCHGCKWANYAKIQHNTVTISFPRTQQIEKEVSSLSCAKKRQHVTSYEVHVQGIRAKEHPKVFVEISVEHVVTGHNIQLAAVERAIWLSETRYCGAEAMLGKAARIKNTYRIVEV